MRRTFTKMYATLALVLISTLGFSQGIVKGITWDGDMNEAMVGANVVVKGTMNGVTTDFDGNFELSIEAGKHTLIFSFIGYSNLEVPVTVKEGQTVDLGKKVMNADAVGLQEIQLIASVAVDRKTPVAVSTISPAKIQEKLGTQEFPEILKSTPGVYATRQGGGYGDSRINLRGFNSENVAVMINGVPVNDMENGRVYWSNWAGLSEVTRSMQVQRGLGASKVAVPSVGGTINILTNTTEAKKGGTIYTGIGNNGRRKVGLSLSTGMMDNGFAVSLSGSMDEGDGLVDGTWHKAYSYFLNISKVIGDDHIISFTAFGAPQEHGQRYDRLKIADYQKYPEGINYNPNYGYLDGQMLNERRNFYNKPQISLNWYWTINETSNLSTAAYVSYGTGGGTGSLGSTVGKTVDTGLLDYESARDANIANGSSLSIIRASRNDHKWYGILSVYEKEASENLKFSVGLDSRYYLGTHFREVVDLLGGEYYVDRLSDVNNLNNKAKVGDKIAYYNDGIVVYGGAFAQVEYSTDKLSTFLSGSVSETSYKRTDYFQILDTDEQTTDAYNFFGYMAKAGANYNLTDNHNVFVNTGYFERAPFFKSVFPTNKNDEANGEAENEKVLSFEAGYGARYSKFALNANVYWTQWKDKSMVKRIPLQVGEEYNANITGVNAIHMGVEADFRYNPNKKLTITGMVSVGNWTWQNDLVDVPIIGDDGNQAIGPDGKPVFVDLFIGGLKVGNSAQTTTALGIDYELFDGFKFGMDWNFYGNLYADFDPLRRGDVEEKGIDPWKMKDYHLFDFNAKYSFKIGKVDASLFGNVNNLFNSEYISDGFDGTDHDWQTSSVYYGVGRTYSIGMKVKF